MSFRNQISDEQIPDGWDVSVAAKYQVDLLRSEPLEGEDRRRSLMIRKHGKKSYNVKGLARYGPDGCPLLAEGVDLARAIRVVQAEARAVDAGCPTEGESDQSDEEVESESGESEDASSLRRITDYT